MEPKVWNTLWISDVHLGTRECRAGQLHAFLKANKCHKLYLVGDIIDGWRIATSKWYWPGEHNKILRLILRMAEKEGTRVSYVPGNHDEFLRSYITEQRLQMGNISVVEEAVHVTANGKRLWVVHGDAFDGVTRHHRIVTLLGDAGYSFLLMTNGALNLLRRLFHLPYWSLSGSVKKRVKTAAKYIADFEQAVAHEAAKRGYDGVVCGHIHQASKTSLEAVDYYNCGDWVESCTALAEDENGEIHLIHSVQQDIVKDNVIPLKLTA